MTQPRTARFDAHREAVAIAVAAERALEHESENNEPLLHVLQMRLERERDAGLRLRLARAYLGLQRTSRLPVAVKWIHGNDPILRRAAHDLLKDLGKEALPALLELSSSRDPGVRWCAYEVAARLHRPSMAQVLIRGLQDDDPGNRWMAGSGLIAAGDRALIPILVALVISGPTLPFHVAARRVLARLEVPQHEDVMMRLLDSLARGTTTTQSGPLASELLTALRRDTALRTRVRTVRASAQSVAGEGEVQMTTKVMTVIRAAHHEDAAAVQSLWEESGLTRARDDEWNALTAGATSAIFVAEDAGRIVGAVVATFDGWRAYIYHVAVSEHLRGQGIGRDLMVAAEQFLMGAGARHAHMAVHEENTDGLALAVAAGYLPEGERVLAKAFAVPDYPADVAIVGRPTTNLEGRAQGRAIEENALNESSVGWIS